MIVNGKAAFWRSASSGRQLAAAPVASPTFIVEWYGIASLPETVPAAYGVLASMAATYPGAFEKDGAGRASNLSAVLRRTSALIVAKREGFYWPGCGRRLMIVSKRRNHIGGYLTLGVAVVVAWALGARGLISFIIVAAVAFVVCGIAIAVAGLALLPPRPQPAGAFESNFIGLGLSRLDEPKGAGTSKPSDLRDGTASERNG